MAPRKPKVAPASEKKLFVLDTNVLLHDPFSSLKFKEHDIFIPFVTLEELDGKKSGVQDVNRNARQATRILDTIVSQAEGGMQKGYPLTGIENCAATGTLFVQTQALSFLSKEHLHKNDNMYLAVLNDLQNKGTHSEVVLITKDLNLRIKARALGYKADDFLYDHVIDDADYIYKGWRSLSEEEVSALLENCVSSKQKGATYYTVPHTNQRINEFLLFPDESMFRVIDIQEGNCYLESVPFTDKEKNAVLGITSRNVGQRAALSLLTDPNIDIVALLGPAGTGKTMMAVASALAGIQAGTYDKLLFTRANTPVGDDIGFLPGTEAEKMEPWVGALHDNLEVIAESQDSPEKGQKIRELAESSVEVKAITFMRGRTFFKRVIILDEAQNLTPKQMRTLITRAGDGTKFIVLGNLSQIDSPYLSEASSGLAFLVERMKDWPYFGALVLDKGERSRLANAANERL